MTRSSWDCVLGHAQARGKVPSLAAAVVRDGSVAWTSGDIGLQYRVGSITKVIVAVLMMRARDEGLLGLDDPLGKHLPETAYADRTLRELLSHTAGIPSEPGGPWWERSPGVPFSELALGEPPFAPGETFHYSNVGFALLGEVVARAFASDWWTLAQERVLRPLGMTRTTYHPEAPHAQGYSVHPYAGTLTEEPHQDTLGMAAAGQLWSTVSDLTRLMTLLIEDPLVGEMAEHVMPGYGLGLWLIGDLIGHPGSMPGFQASLFVSRERGIGAVVLANSTAGLVTDTITPDLLDPPSDAVEVPEPWVPVTDVPDAVRDVLGVWHWGNTAYVFTWNGTEIVASHLRTMEDRETFALRDGVFVGTSGYHHGEILHVHDDHLEVATFVFTRTPYDPAVPVPGGHPPVK